MKIAIISDLHLGFRQYGSIEREEDFYNQFYKVCEEINKYNPNIVIIAGDLFDKPNPSPAAINAYRSGVSYFNADIICTIKGNHTMILRDDHYSIDEFFGGEEFKGYFYLDDNSMTTHDFAYQFNFSKYMELPNIQIDGITYRTNSNIQEFLDKQKEISELEQKVDYRILIVHQSFKEFCGFTGEKLSIEDINYSPYDIIICGHIHSRFDTILSNGTKFIQPGSIERMNTTEAKDEENNGKGFYLLDTDENSLEFYKVECPRKFFLGEITINTKEELENHLKEMDKIVKKLDYAPIISYTYKSNIKNIEDIRKEIDVIKENVLLNKSNIDDQTQDEIVIELEKNGIPSVIESIKIYGEKYGLSEEECLLAIDLHKALNDDNSENIQGLLDNYFEKHKKKEKIEKIDFETDLKEVIEYFGG